MLPSGTDCSSHNDEARLTRRQDHSAAWAQVTGRAIGGYRELERQSGIEFFHDVGCLIAARPGADGVSADPVVGMDEIGVDHTLYRPGDRSWQDRWPSPSLPHSHYVAHEPAPAGCLRPKRLIQTQNVLASKAGAKQVLVAAGGFANFNNLLPSCLDMTIKSEVIVLGEVPSATATQRSRYPTVKYMIDPGELQSICMVPPVCYPDGRFYMKMGANTTRDLFLTRLADVQRWFRADTDLDFLPMFELHLRSLWPDVDFLSVRTEPCIITRTPTGFPIIERVVEGLFVATAGNVAGAKGSDIWGERAADLIESSG